MKLYTIAFTLIFFTFFQSSCDRKSSAPSSRIKRKVEKKIINISKPENNSVFVLGDTIRLELTKPDTLDVDSVIVFNNGQQAGKYSWGDDIAIESSSFQVGKSGIRARTYFQGKSETSSMQIELLSDIKPIQYGYRKVNEYTHDEGAYTQGLQYYDGWLYEGTGNYNQSTVRKVRLSNGEVIQIRNNASDIFGEGIAVFENKIYQLTYKSQMCFVYDLNTFDEINKFYFQNREGWGLATFKDELVMSEGTNVLYFIDPAMFTIKRQLEVYDDEGPVDSLNELEYIKGKIYANRYYTDEIVIIDPTTGKVEGRVNLKGILPVKERKTSTNVLNGIAWDEGQDRIFVTGKYWPKLYEIVLVK